jgi:hypothetical protein
MGMATLSVLMLSYETLGIVGHGRGYVVSNQCNKRRATANDDSDAAFDDTPEGKPGCGWLRTALGLPTNLCYAQSCNGDEDDANAKETHDANLLAAWHLEVPEQADGKSHYH